MRRSHAPDAPKPRLSGHALGVLRHGTESEIAGAIVYLLSEAAAYVTGMALRIDGGLHNMGKSSFYEVPEHDRAKPCNGFPLYRPPKVLGCPSSD
jgi:citronellol/citronellal dehydrogenase